MSPFGIFWLCIFLVFVVVIARLMRRREPDFYDIDRLPPLRDDHPALGGGKPPARSNPRTRHVALTPRMIERVNIQRKLRGKPPMNRAGFQNAIAHPWGRSDERRPSNDAGWLAYLIAYNVFSQDHMASTVGQAGGIMIDHDAPYNGQGGAFAGAGASGSWGNLSAPDVAAAAATIVLEEGPTQTVQDTSPSTPDAPSFDSSSSSSFDASGNP